MTLSLNILYRSTQVLLICANPPAGVSQTKEANGGQLRMVLTLKGIVQVQKAAHWDKTT